MWIKDSGRDVTSAFVGITTPARDLYEEIERRGWTVSSVSIKDGQYSCQIKSPNGETIEKTGPNENTAIGHALMALVRQESIRQPRVANWNWKDQVGDIAQAYAEAPAYDSKAAAGWKELADDMAARAQAIKQQIEVEYVDDPDPYKDINEMCDDVIKNRHISVSKANAEHPIWNRNQVLDYRLVRDVLGHCQAGGDYSWYGENQATAAMMPLLSENAQKALFTESIGQAAYNNHFRGYGPQKITFLDLDQTANDPDHAGIHPNQTLVPGEVARMSAVEDADPNANWSSNVHPLPDNAYLWTRDSVTGLDPLDWQGARDAAAQVDTRWSHMSNPDENDNDTKRQAVANALRAAILSPRKPMQWGAQHYQNIADIPARVSDPMRFWNTLEERRDDHNQSIGLEPGVHRYAWAPEEQAFKQWITSVEPTLAPDEVERKAQEELFHMLAEEEQRIMQEDAKGQMTSDEIERKAHKAIRKRLKLMTKGNFDDKTDSPDMLYSAASQLEGPYYPYLANQVKALAGVGRHADSLLAGAMRDVRNGGKGHDFRKEVLRLNLPNVGPREASHAWLMLQPQSSELAVIDPHVKDLLDHKPDAIDNRDYFKLERQLAAGRDAAGYNHVPLGMFGWAMSDYKRGGHGHHRDHRSMRPLNPLPYHDQEEPIVESKWKAPHWWKATDDARNQIGKQFDADIGANFKSTDIPFQKLAYKGMGPVQSFNHWWDKEKPINPKKAKILAEYAAGEKMSQKQVDDYLERHKDEVTNFSEFKKKFMKTFKRYKQSSNGGRVPYFVHTDGNHVEGAPGTPLMRHIKDQTGLTTQQIWEQIAEAGKR